MPFTYSFGEVINTGLIEEGREDRQGGQLGDYGNRPARGNEDLFGGSGEKRADTRVMKQTELTSLLNIP